MVLGPKTHSKFTKRRKIGYLITNVVHCNVGGHKEKSKKSTFLKTHSFTQIKAPGSGTGVLVTK